MSQTVAVESGSVEPRGDLKAWMVCLSAGLFFLYEFFQLNIFDVINQPLRDTFHIDAAQLSWMSSSYLWANILFLLPAGAILDRVSIRKVILISMLVCIVGTLGFALSHSFISAALFHALAGVGNAFCFLACVVLITYWFPPNKQALVIGSVVTMAFIGGMLAHTPFAYINSLLGWRNALLVDAVIGVVFLVWIFFVVTDRPAGMLKKNQSGQTHVIKSFGMTLTNMQNWLAGLFTCLLNLPILVLCALWGASYLQVVHQVSAITASNIVSMIYVGSIFGCPLVGWLSDTLERRKPLMILGAVCALIIVALLVFNLHISEFNLGIIFFTLGLVTSTQVISYPLVAESNAAENTGAATGFASVIIMGGGGVAQVVFGWLLAMHAGSTQVSYSVADFQYAMWIFPVSALAALIAALLLRETFCKRF